MEIPLLPPVKYLRGFDPHLLLLFFRSQKDIEGKKDIKLSIEAERKFFLRLEAQNRIMIKVICIKGWFAEFKAWSSKLIPFTYKVKLP